MTIQNLALRAQKFAVDNSPLILTSVGVAGVVTTAVLTGKATFKAAELVNDNTREVYEELEPKEKLKLVWKLYIPPMLSAGFTIVAIVGANRIGTRRAAAMAAAYSLSEKAFEEYRDKVAEKFNTNKEREVRDEIQQDHMTKNPVTSSQVVITSNGDVLCYDKYTARYFTSDMESIKQAQNNLNHKLLNSGYASLNDFYALLELDYVSFGDDVGWNSDELLEVIFSTVMSDDQRPCIAIDFHVKPIKDYFRTH